MKSEQTKRIEYYGLPTKSLIKEEKECMKKKLPAKASKQWEIFFFFESLAEKKQSSFSSKISEFWSYQTQLQECS